MSFENSSAPDAPRIDSVASAGHDPLPGPHEVSQLIGAATPSPIRSARSTELAGEAVPGCESASITMIRDSHGWPQQSRTPAEALVSSPEYALTPTRSMAAIAGELNPGSDRGLIIGPAADPATGSSRNRRT